MDGSCKLSEFIVIVDVFGLFGVEVTETVAGGVDVDLSSFESLRTINGLNSTVISDSGVFGDEISVSLISGAFFCAGKTDDGGGAGAKSFLFNFGSDVSGDLRSVVSTSCGREIGGIIGGGGGGAGPFSFLVTFLSLSVETSDSFESSLLNLFLSIAMGIGTSDFRFLSSSIGEAEAGGGGVGVAGDDGAAAAIGIGVDSLEPRDTFDKDVGVSGTEEENNLISKNLNSSD